MFLQGKNSKYNSKNKHEIHSLKLIKKRTESIFVIMIFDKYFFQIIISNKRMKEHLIHNLQNIIMNITKQSRGKCIIKYKLTWVNKRKY